MSTIPVYVVRAVRVADGTVHGRMIIADTEDAVPADVYQGLLDEGFVIPLGDENKLEPPAEEVAIDKPRRGRPPKVR